VSGQLHAPASLLQNPGRELQPLDLPARSSICTDWATATHKTHHRNSNKYYVRNLYKKAIYWVCKIRETKRCKLEMKPYQLDTIDSPVLGGTSLPYARNSGFLVGCRSIWNVRKCPSRDYDGLASFQKSQIPRNRFWNAWRVNVVKSVSAALSTWTVRSIRTLQIGYRTQNWVFFKGTRKILIRFQYFMGPIALNKTALFVRFLREITAGSLGVRMFVDDVDVQVCIIIATNNDLTTMDFITKVK
jgi:hypothetical protein